MEHNIPIIERPELTRKLYATLEVGQSIPVDLYDVFVEILKYVYTRDRQDDRRPTRRRRRRLTKTATASAASRLNTEMNSQSADDALHRLQTPPGEVSARSLSRSCLRLMLRPACCGPTGSITRSRSFRCSCDLAEAQSSAIEDGGARKAPQRHAETALDHHARRLSPDSTATKSATANEWSSCHRKISTSRNSSSSTSDCSLASWKKRSTRFDAEVLIAAGQPDFAAVTAGSSEGKTRKRKRLLLIVVSVGTPSLQPVEQPVARNR